MRLPLTWVFPTDKPNISNMIVNPAVDRTHVHSEFSTALDIPDSLHLFILFPGIWLAFQLFPAAKTKGTELARDRMVSACWTETESPSCCPRCSAGRDPLSRRTPSSKPHVKASRGKCWWMKGWWLFCYFEGGIATECRVGNYFSSISIRFGMPPWSMDYITCLKAHKEAKNAYCFTLIPVPWFHVIPCHQGSWNPCWQLQGLRSLVFWCFWCFRYVFDWKNIWKIISKFW